MKFLGDCWSTIQRRLCLVFQEGNALEELIKKNTKHNGTSSLCEYPFGIIVTARLIEGSRLFYVVSMS